MNPSTRTRWHCPPKPVLAAVDFGDASARALAIGGVLASACDARLRALHAERFEPPPYFTLEQIAQLEAERRMAQAAAADHLVRFTAGATPYPVQPIIVDEPPVEAILHAAASADVIIAGTHGRRGPGRWWLGSVAERLVRAATLPVLVTRAAAGPALEVFERLVLIGERAEPGAAARSCAERLAGAFGGRVTEGGLVTRCQPGVMREASLVVMATDGERPSWTITDAVARALNACERPILFVPAH